MENFRLRLTIQGTVQGVGFRPFVYRIATELQLTGWVNNSAQGVFIEVEGSREKLESFLEKIKTEKPPRAHVTNLEASWLDPIGYTRFEIRTSVSGEKTAIILPDIATCEDCKQEIFDPSNRRDRYPFTNCTNCGPRYSIIKALPYDRCNTTMQAFQMCPECQSEYENPLNRRFHAQPNACPRCGPHLELWDTRGKVLATHDSALLTTADAIRDGRIVAIRGLGGFHLVVDARNEVAVKELRQRKRRWEKPFAVMYPSLELVKENCEVSPAEESLLLSPEAPIVLLRNQRERGREGAGEVGGAGGAGGAGEIGKNDQSPITNHPLPITQSKIAPTVAPGNPYLGVMLPYTPLHHLLMAELGFPIVATSGNLSDEPLCIDEQEALQRLGDIADLFLVHNRPIARPLDDSVVRIVASRPLVLRRARGYAPLPIPQSKIQPPPLSPRPRVPVSPCQSQPTTYNHTHKEGNPKSKILAVGAYLKNAIAISVNNQVFLSQHIGDLETPQAFENFQRVIASLSSLYEFQPTAVACDAHPDYRSTQFAQHLGIPVIPVQHHYAHALACMAENELEAPVLSISWDGTGYGANGTIWGGEFLYITPTSFQRVAHLRPFRLPGGDKAVKEPRRIALGLLYEIFGDELFGMKSLRPLQAFSPQELAILQTMLRRNLNTPVTSSAGRLFDAVASLVGLRQKDSFEGQAAMKLEFALDGIETNEYYPWEIGDGEIGEQLPITNLQSPLQVDWLPMVLAILDELHQELPLGLISAKFHNTLVEAMVAVAKQVGEQQVVLTGGCFQNNYLTERAIYRLTQENFRPYWHQRIPPNDGGIALGQVIAAQLNLKN